MRFKITQDSSRVVELDGQPLGYGLRKRIAHQNTLDDESPGRIQTPEST